MNRNLTESDLSYIQWIFGVTKTYVFYSNLVMSPTAIILNIITLIIYLRKKFRNTTIGFYNLFICVSDIIVMIFAFVIYFPTSLDRDFTIVNESLCKFFNFFFRFMMQLSSWLNVAFTLDRLICIKYSNKRFEFIKKKKFILLLIFLLACLCLVVNSPNFGFYFKKTTLNNQTTITCTAESSIILTRDINNILFRGLLPFFFMLIINLFLVKNFIESKKKFKTDKSMKKEYVFSYLTIFRNIIFLINLLPLCVSLICLNVFLNIQNRVLYSAFILVFNIAGNVSAFNNTFPFFIHLKFNKLFYQEFLILLNRFKIIVKNEKQTVISSINPK